MSRPYGTPYLLIEDGGEVVRVNIAEREGDDTAALAGIGTVDGQARHSLQLLQRIGRDLALVLADEIHTERVQIVNRCSQANRFGDSWSTGLEFPGQIVPGGFAQVDHADHFAASHEGGHGL